MDEQVLRRVLWATVALVAAAGIAGAAYYLFIGTEPLTTSPSGEPVSATQQERSALLDTSVQATSTPSAEAAQQSRVQLLEQSQAPAAQQSPADAAAVQQDRASLLSQ